jgi:hypothetical protein
MKDFSTFLAWFFSHYQNKINLIEIQGNERVMAILRATHARIICKESRATYINTLCREDWIEALNTGIKEDFFNMGLYILFVKYCKEKADPKKLAENA